MKYKVNGKYVTLEEFNNLWKLKLPNKYEIIQEDIALEDLSERIEELEKKIEGLEKKIEDQQNKITSLELKSWTTGPLTTGPWSEPYKIYCGAGEPIKTSITCSYGNTETKNNIQ